MQTPPCYQSSEAGFEKRSFWLDGNPRSGMSDQKFFFPRRREMLAHSKHKIGGTKLETNSSTKNSKFKAVQTARFEFRASDFEFVSDFVLQISCFHFITCSSRIAR